MPWWTCHFVHWVVNIPSINIYAYGLRHNWIQLSSYIAADETPFYQTVLAWIYIIISGVLALSSTWPKGRKGQFLLGAIGIIYIAYAAIASFVVIAGRLADFGISLQGMSDIVVEGGESVRTFAHLRFGYYLAYIAGSMCIILALLRNIIVGRTKLGA
jgi:hypothetical protein